ncbi:MAG TPA: nitroreductase family deazaflavin-dependent oxidoreductase [Blastocatellia bacterium]|nr:nitroreductase family deazaflavin-dependent oxidoreductase [Blastocatellia bacterium]
MTINHEFRGRRPSRLSAAIQNLITAIHTFIYRLTRGAVGGSIVNSPVLLLTTSGRRSGKPRTVPLLYLADGDRVVLVASNGGAARHPAWWLNLQANPEARIEIDGGRRKVIAELAAAEEKQRLWPLLTAMYAGYGRYQEITDREIPVVILRSLRNTPGPG